MNNDWIISESNKADKSKGFLILENPDSELELSKQHQIYGAIKEIENFLRTLDHLRELELSDSMKFQLSNDMHEGFFSKMSKGIKR